jgi:hypothetical protein
MNVLCKKLNETYDTKWLKIGEEFVSQDICENFYKVSSEHRNREKGKVNLMRLIYNSKFLSENKYSRDMYLVGPSSFSEYYVRKYDKTICIFGETENVEYKCPWPDKIKFEDYLLELIRETGCFLDIFLDTSFANNKNNRSIKFKKMFFNQQFDLANIHSVIPNLINKDDEYFDFQNFFENEYDGNFEKLIKNKKFINFITQYSDADNTSNDYKYGIELTKRIDMFKISLSYIGKEIYELGMDYFNVEFEGYYRKFGYKCRDIKSFINRYNRYKNSDPQDHNYNLEYKRTLENIKEIYALYSEIILDTVGLINTLSEIFKDIKYEKPSFDKPISKNNIIIYCSENMAKNLRNFLLSLDSTEFVRDAISRNVNANSNYSSSNAPLYQCLNLKEIAPFFGKIHTRNENEFKKLSKEQVIQRAIDLGL